MSSRLEPQTRAGTYTAVEMMTIAAARALPNGATCLVGIGLPGTAAILARRVHAPELVLVYESGPIGAKPAYLPLSIGDGVLAETADTVVSLVEIFNYWVQPGRIDVGFLSAAQLDVEIAPLAPLESAARPLTAPELCAAPVPEDAN